jgi:hypothetical protein
MIAHVYGLPFEELLVGAGAGAALVGARVWMSVHLRRTGTR